jgi:WD40 repeat protein
MRRGRQQRTTRRVVAGGAAVVALIGVVLVARSDNNDGRAPIVTIPDDRVEPPPVTTDRPAPPSTAADPVTTPAIEPSSLLTPLGTHHAFSPDGQLLAAADGSGSGEIWDVASGERIRELRPAVPTNGTPLGAVDPVFSPDGTRVVIVGGSVSVWDVATGAEIATLPGVGTVVNAVAFSADGTRIATAGANPQIALFDTTTFAPLVTFVPTLDHDPVQRQLHCSIVNCIYEEITGEHYWNVETIEFSPDGSKILTSDASTAKLWDSTNLGLIGTLYETSANGNAFSPDGSKVVTGHPDGACYLIWATSAANTSVDDPADPEGRVCIWPASAPPYYTERFEPTFSPDGASMLLLHAEDRLALWPTVGEYSLPLESWPGSDQSASPLVQFVAPPDVTAELADATMSPDGTTVAGAFGGLAVLWDATTGDIITTFTHPAPIVSVTYNPDGQHLATTAADGSVELWPIP